MRDRCLSSFERFAKDINVPSKIRQLGVFDLCYNTCTR